MYEIRRDFRLINSTSMVPTPSDSNDPHVIAWAAAVGGATSTLKGYLSTLVTSLKSTGEWNTIDRILPLASDNATQALTCIKSLQTATNVNSCTFAAGRGFTGNGTSAYIDTNFVPSTAGGNTTLNSQSYLGYDLTNRGAANLALMGSGNTGIVFDFILPYWSDGKSYGDLGNNANVNAANPGPNSQGLYVVSRTSSVQLNLERNGVSVASSGASTSVALSDNSVLLLASRGPGAQNWSSDEIGAIAIIAGGWNGTQRTNVASYVNAFATSLGINTY